MSSDFSPAAFQHAVEVAGGCLLECDLRHGDCRWSRPLIEASGAGDAPPSLHDLRRAIHPDDLATWDAAWQGLMADATRATANWRTRLRGPDGGIRLLACAMRVQRDAAGVPQRLFALFTDITDAERDNTAIRASEARYRLVADAAEVGILEYDLDTGRAAWTPHLWEIFGLPPHPDGLDFAGIVALAHPDDRESLSDAFAAARQDAATDRATIVFRILRPDGAIRHLAFFTIGVRDEAGILRKIHAVVSDITSPREAELALCKSEKRLRIATEAANLGVAERDLRTNVSTWSARMWEIMGIAPRPSGPSTGVILSRVHPEDRERVRTANRAALLDGKAERVSLTFRIMRPDGSMRELEEHVTGDYENGRLVKVYGTFADVTAARADEAALKTSEARHRLALAAARQGVFERDLVTGQLVYSERTREIMGLPVHNGEVNAEDIYRVVHPADRDRLREINRAMAAGEFHTPSDIDFRVVWPDGSIHHVRQRMACERDAAGAVLKIYGAIADVTEAREATAQRRRREHRFRLSLDAGGLAVFERDLATELVIGSPRMFEITGILPRPSMQVRLSEIFAIVHPDDRKRIRIANARVLFEGAVNRLVHSFRIVRPGGDVRHVDLHLHAEHDDAGVLRKIYGTAADVTERFEAEAVLKATDAQLRLAVAAADLGVLERDLVGDKSVWSPRMWAIHGFEPRAGAPNAAELDAMIHPDDRVRVLQERAEAMRDPAVARRAFEFRIVRPDGAIRHIMVATLNSYDSAGQLSRINGVVSDVTEQRELLGQVQIAANLATLGQMATGIAHEFGQPLQAIVAQAALAQVLMEAAGDAGFIARVRAALHKVETQAERLGATMRHLLVFGLGPAPRQPDKPPPESSFARAMDGVVDLIGTMLAIEGVKLIIDVPDDLPNVQYAKLELERVMINICLNARDAMRGCALQKLRVTASLAGTAVQVDIDDTGHGLTDAVLPQVFDPFFTTKPVGEGSGMGLSLSRTMIQNGGGTITAHKLPRGARFSLRLPCAAE